MGEEDEDRISQLPDPILLHILSFIDITQAIQTTILSTRWKNLCFSLSDLHFNLSRAAAHAGVNLRNWSSARSFSHRFSLFVSHYLSRRDASVAVRSFRLSFDSRLIHVDAEFVERCAVYAVNHGAEFLHLQAICRPAIRIPADFFSSKSLRELKLSQLSYGIYIPLKEFSLPNLKTLDLDESVFIDDYRFYSFSKEPFSIFPALEKLTLRRSITLYGLVISAPRLRFLEIIQDKLYSDVMEEISAPLLTSFRYEGCFPLECSSVNLPMLEEVSVNIHKKSGSNTRQNQKQMALKFGSLLQQLRNAKTVALTLDALEVLEMGGGAIEQSPSPFPYMRCLKLRKGRGEIRTVLKRVMDYLTEGSLYSDTMVVELPRGVSVVEKNSEELFDEMREPRRAFGVEDEASSFQIRNFGVFQELLAPKFGKDGRPSRAAAHTAVNLNDPQAAQAFSLQFSHFISLFLKDRGAAAVRSFHLSFDSPLVHVEAEFVEKCIDYAVKHGVESLRLDAVCHTEMWLPAAFFASETLLELELRQFGGGICVPEEFSLPNLKTLYLENSVFVNNDEFFSFSESKEPFSGFPELEKLTLRQCTVYGLAIIAQKLRVLEIIQDEQFNEGIREINAPLLTSFRYEGDFPLECWKINQPMLEEVYLDIHEKVTPAPNRRFENLPWNRDGMYLKRVRMFEQLRNAKSVTMTLDTLKALEMERDLIMQSCTSPFANMECLKLRMGRREIETVVKRVVEYLTDGSSLCSDDSTAVELPEGVSVVDMKWDDLFDEDNQLQLLFGEEDKMPPWLCSQY